MTTSPSDDRARSAITRRRALVGLGASAGVALGVGGLYGWRSLTRSEPVTIGASLPLSGRLEQIGRPLHRGLRLLVEQVNDRGGLHGRPVDLRIVDDEGRPDAARSAFRSLVDSADLLVAPYGSDATGAVIDTVEDAGVPCVAPTAGDRGLWSERRSWTVQLLNPVDTFLHGALAAAAGAGARSVGFVHRDDGFTRTTMQGAIDRAREDGWDVRDVATYGSEDDVEPAMAEVLDTDPALLVGGGFRPGAAGGGFLPDALALSRAHERSSASARHVCWSIGASFPAFADRRGDEADGAMGVTGWKPYVSYPDNDDFVDRFADQMGNAPDAHAAQGYAAGQILEAAVANGGALDRERIVNALFELETETVFGRYRVDEHGLQIGKANAVVQWQAGTPVVVWPDRWASGELVSGR